MPERKTPWDDLSLNQQRKCNENPKSKAWWVRLGDGRLCFRIDFNDIVKMDLHFVRFAGCSVDLRNSDGISIFLLFLNENSDKDVFARFCQVLLEIPVQNGGQEYADSMLRVLFQWMKFLRKVNDSKEMDIRKQIGLIGELSFMQLELHKRKGFLYKEILKYWTGPEKAPNDFILGSVSFEIKGHNYDENSIHISNEQQLIYNGHPLYLVVYSVAKDDNGKKLSDIVFEIRNEIIAEDASLLALFDQKLFYAGYNPAVSYTDLTSYFVDNPCFYLVDDGFPCIIKKGVSSAIVNVRYNLLLPEIQSFSKPDWNT